MKQPQRQYWAFYWPLILVGIVFLSGQLVRNRVLLGYDRGEAEFAVFTLALAVFGPFQAPLIFVPQVTNLLVRGPRSLLSCVRFLAVMCVVLTTPLLLLAWTPLGALLLPCIYDLGPERVAYLQGYLRYFAPVVVMGCGSGMVIGLLVQAGRTGLFTVLRTAYVCLLVGLLATGVALSFPPTRTIGLAMILAEAGHLALAVLLYARYAAGAGHAAGAQEADRALPTREVASVFLPMMGTSLMFTLTRPIIYGFLTGVNPKGDPALPNVDRLVSAVSLAFSFNMIFHSAINQFRNLLVTFGKDDLQGVRRFLRKATAVVMCLMVAVVASPLAAAYLRYLQGAQGELLLLARQAMWPLCLIPFVAAWRNYYHGISMVRRRTASMMVGGVARVVSVYAFARALSALGLYNHVAAASMLVLAFAAEAAAVGALLSRRRAHGAPLAEEP